MKGLHLKGLKNTTAVSIDEQKGDQNHWMREKLFIQRWKAQWTRLQHLTIHHSVHFTRNEDGNRMRSFSSEDENRMTKNAFIQSTRPLKPQHSCFPTSLRCAWQTPRSWASSRENFTSVRVYKNLRSSQQNSCNYGKSSVLILSPASEMGLITGAHAMEFLHLFLSDWSFEIVKCGSSFVWLGSWRWLFRSWSVE